MKSWVRHCGGKSRTIQVNWTLCVSACERLQVSRRYLMRSGDHTQQCNRVWRLERSVERNRVLRWFGGLPGGASAPAVRECYDSRWVASEERRIAVAGTCVACVHRALACISARTHFFLLCVNDATASSRDNCVYDSCYALQFVHRGAAPQRNATHRV